MMSYDQFIELVRRLSNHQPEGVKIGEKLLTLWQGERIVAEYTHCQLVVDDFIKV